MSANDVISRMSPETLVSFLSDLTETDNGQAGSELISLAAYELIANVGSDAIMLLSEACVKHPLIDEEIRMFAEEMEITL